VDLPMTIAKVEEGLEGGSLPKKKVRFAKTFWNNP
jgi:hypothetical protein